MHSHKNSRTRSTARPALRMVNKSCTNSRSRFWSATFFFSFLLHRALIRRSVRISSCAKLRLSNRTTLLLIMPLPVLLKKRFFHQQVRCPFFIPLLVELVIQIMIALFWFVVMQPQLMCRTEVLLGAGCGNKCDTRCAFALIPCCEACGISTSCWCQRLPRLIEPSEAFSNSNLITVRVQPNLQWNSPQRHHKKQEYKPINLLIISSSPWLQASRP